MAYVLDASAILRFTYIEQALEVAPDARELKMEILERDGWKCQHCCRRDQLQIHDIIRRSQLGADGEDNLIVLCRGCHHWLHLTGAKLSRYRSHRGYSSRESWG